MKIGIAIVAPPIVVCGRFHTPNAMLPSPKVVSIMSFENNGIVMEMALGLSVLYCIVEYPV